MGSNFQSGGKPQALAAADVVAGNRILIKPAFFPKKSIQAESCSLAQRAGQAALGGVVAFFGAIKGELSLGCPGRVAGYVLHRAGKGVAAVQSALRSFYDFHPLHIQHARVDQQGTACHTDRLAGDVDAINERGGVGTPPRGRQAADHQPRVGGRKAHVELQAGVVVGDFVEFLDAGALHVFAAYGVDRDGNILQVLLFLARGDDDLLDHSFILGLHRRRQRHQQSHAQSNRQGHKSSPR